MKLDLSIQQVEMCIKSDIFTVLFFVEIHCQTSKLADLMQKELGAEEAIEIEFIKNNWQSYVDYFLAVDSQQKLTITLDFILGIGAIPMNEIERVLLSFSATEKIKVKLLKALHKIGYKGSNILAAIFEKNAATRPYEYQSVFGIEMEFQYIPLTEAEAQFSISVLSGYKGDEYYNLNCHYSLYLPLGGISFETYEQAQACVEPLLAHINLMRNFEQQMAYQVAISGEEPSDFKIFKAPTISLIEGYTIEDYNDYCELDADDENYCPSEIQLHTGIEIISNGYLFYDKVSEVETEYWREQEHIVEALKNAGFKPIENEGVKMFTNVIKYPASFAHIVQTAIQEFAQIKAEELQYVQEQLLQITPDDFRCEVEILYNEFCPIISYQYGEFYFEYDFDAKNMGGATLNALKHKFKNLKDGEIVKARDEKYARWKQRTKN
jgi:hypothetical protein